MIDVQNIKTIVLNYAKRAYEKQLFAGTSGNLSVCLRDKGLIAITPSGVRYETMQVEDISVIDINGNIVEGERLPSTETLMHCEIYKAMEDVNAVVHTHSPYATAFAVNNKNVPLVLIEMILFLGGDIPLAKFEIPGTRELGISAVEAMKDRRGCLLANHGVVAIGDDMDKAFIRAEYIEDAAKIASIAMQNGPIVEIPKEIEDEMKN